MLKAIMITIGLFASSAFAQTQEIKIVLKDRKIVPDKIVWKAQTPVVLVVTNEDNATEEIESHKMKIEKLVPPKKTVKIHVKALKPGEYDLFGEFHPETSKAIVTVE